MKHITTTVSLFLVALAISFASVQPVFASEVEAEQEAENSTSTEVECTTGSYGQNVNCTTKADATASAKQKVYVREDGTVIEKHETADAALDARSLAVVASSLFAGAAGVAVKFAAKA